MHKNITRVQNCPDVTISNSLFALLVFFSFCHVVFLSFCHFPIFVFLLFCLFVFLSYCLFCLFVMLSFCLYVIFEFLSFCPDIMLIKCLKGPKYQKSLFVSKFKSGSQSVSDWLIATLEFRHKEWLSRLQTLQTFDQHDVWTKRQKLKKTRKLKDKDQKECLILWCLGSFALTVLLSCDKKNNAASLQKKFGQKKQSAKLT